MLCQLALHLAIGDTPFHITMFVKEGQTAPKSKTTSKLDEDSRWS